MVYRFLPMRLQVFADTSPGFGRCVYRFLPMRLQVLPDASIGFAQCVYTQIDVIYTKIYGIEVGGAT